MLEAPCALAARAPASDTKYTAYGSGGGAAIDIAIKTADERPSELILSEDPSGEVTQVPLNDPNPIEDG